MYVPLYIPDTVLTSPLVLGESLLPVPTDVYAYAQASLAALDSGNLVDWSYFKIQKGSEVEIVKLIGLIEPNLFIILRAQDNTQQYSFDVGAILSYADTVAAYYDGYEVPELNVSLEEGMWGDLDDYGFAYFSPNIQTTGGLEILGNSTANIVIAHKEEAHGCCSDKPAIEPIDEG